MLIEQNKTVFEVVKDDYYFNSPLITKDEIVQLINDNRLTEATRYINDNAPVEVISFFYDFACSCFYDKRFDDAELVYSRLIPLDTAETMKFSHKSEFDMTVVYINMGEYEKALNFKRHDRLIVLVDNRSSIMVLLGRLCEYHIARKRLSRILEKTDGKTGELLELGIIDLYEERYLKESAGSEALYKDIGFYELKKISATTGIDIELLKKNRDMINDLYKKLMYCHELIKFFFIKDDNRDYKRLEMEFFFRLPIDTVDFAVAEDRYIDFFMEYFRAKADYLRKNRCDISTSIDSYARNVKYFDTIEMNLNAAVMSNDEIFYSLFKKEVFFMSTLSSTALFLLINDKGIIHDNILKKFFAKVPLFQCGTSYLDSIYAYAVSRNSSAYNFMTDYGIFKLGVQKNDSTGEAQQLFAQVVKNRASAGPEDYVFSLLGLMHVKYLLNPGDLTTVNLKYFETARKALSMRIDSRYSKDYIYNPALGLYENLRGLVNKLNMLFDYDLRLVFLESVIDIIRKNSDSIKENRHLFIED